MKVLHVLNSRIYSGAEKVVCQIIHHIHETRFMDGNHGPQGIFHNRLVDESLGHEVTDGCKVVYVPEVALEEFACAHGQIPVERLSRAV